jgi:hypothetical protein
MKKSSDTKTFELVIDRFEGEKAVLFLEEEEIVVPKKILPHESKEGDSIIATFKTEETSRGEREKKAKELLNEILRA